MYTHVMKYEDFVKCEPHGQNMIQSTHPGIFCYLLKPGAGMTRFPVNFAVPIMIFYIFFFEASINLHF